MWQMARVVSPVWFQLHAHACSGLTRSEDRMDRATVAEYRTDRALSGNVSGFRDIRWLLLA
jgi:hypothetical protein